jgi:hypothetical protein
MSQSTLRNYADYDDYSDDNSTDTEEEQEEVTVRGDFADVQWVENEKKNQMLIYNSKPMDLL